MSNTAENNGYGNKIRACIQVGPRYRAGKLNTYASGRVSCRIFGQVENYWGLQAREGAVYPVLELDADSVDELRTMARDAIDRLTREGGRLLRCESRRLYMACYHVG